MKRLRPLVFLLFATAAQAQGICSSELFGKESSDDQTQSFNTDIVHCIGNSANTLLKQSSHLRKITTEFMIPHVFLMRVSFRFDAKLSAPAGCQIHYEMIGGDRGQKSFGGSLTDCTTHLVQSYGNLEKMLSQMTMLYSTPAGVMKAVVKNANAITALKAQD